MPISVVIVAPWGERLGGAEEMLWMALSNLDRERLQPTVVFLGDGPFAAEVAGLGFATEVIPAGRLRQPAAVLGAVRRLRSLLLRRRPDLLVNWSAKAQLYGSTAAASAGMGDRVVWWQHQIPDGHWIDRIATLLPARAVGCSSRSCETSQQALRPRRRTFVVHPGIEPALLAADTAEAPRGLPSIPNGRTVVGIVGRLQPWKGQDRFLTALAELRAKGRDVHGLVVGGEAFGRSPGYAAALKRQIASAELADRVTMTGQVDDAGPYFELMDVAVNASEEEPFGMVLLEAMAAGVPVVAVGKGGPVDIVEDGVTGILTPSGRPDDLGAAIEDLLEDPVRRRTMGAAGRRRFREHFTAATMAERITAAFEEVSDG